MKKFKGLLVLVLLFVSVFFINSIKALAETDTRYLKVNDTTLEFEKIIYVDGTYGNDSGGDGSKGNPFKTVVIGFDYLNTNCREGGAIVIKDGTYDVSGLFKGTSYNLNARYAGMKIALVAETMGKVQFTNVNEWIVVENSTSARIKVSLYGIIFKTISKSYYHLGGDDYTNEFYNCIIISGYGGWNGNVKNANIKIENSLFVGNPGKDYEDAISGSAINCASTTQYMDPANGTKTNCLYNITIDSDYNITSDGWENTGIGTNPDGTVANIGVYGGQFSWGSTVSEIEVPASPTNLRATADSAQIILNWDAVDEAESYNIKRSTTSDGPYETIATSSAITYNDTDVEPGVTYYYVVSAVVSVIESSNSNEASATIGVAVPVTILKVVLEVGEALRLSVDDDLAENTNMTWTSSENTVATVDGDGVVTALKPGNTVVTVVSKDGSYTDKINVLVVENADDYRLAVDLQVGNSCRLTVDDLTDTVKVFWGSSDTSVAAISDKGKVTAVGEGLTLITATDEEGNIIGQIYVRVRK